MIDKPLGPVSQTIVRTLEDAQNGWVSSDALLAAVYGGSGDKSPIDAASSFRVTVHALRKKGFDIEMTHAYRLKPRR